MTRDLSAGRAGVALQATVENKRLCMSKERKGKERKGKERKKDKEKAKAIQPGEEIWKAAI